MRKSKSRQEMIDILHGGPGRLVILTVRDDIAFLNGRAYVSDFTLSDWVETAHSVGAATVTGTYAYWQPDRPPPGLPRWSHD